MSGTIMLDSYSAPSIVVFHLIGVKLAADMLSFALLCFRAVEADDCVINKIFFNNKYDFVLTPKTALL